MRQRALFSAVTVARSCRNKACPRSSRESGTGVATMWAGVMHSGIGPPYRPSTGDKRWAVPSAKAPKEMDDGRSRVESHC